MAVNTQFSIAVHLLAALGYRSDRDLTSTDLAISVNTSPSFVRRTLARLSKAGLVEATTGKSGLSELAKKPERISLLDIYRAVEAPKVFAIHNYANQEKCEVSCRIKAALENVLKKNQKAMEKSLAEITLASVIDDMRK